MKAVLDLSWRQKEVQSKNHKPDISFVTKTGHIEKLSTVRQSLAAIFGEKHDKFCLR